MCIYRCESQLKCHLTIIVTRYYALCKIQKYIPVGRGLLSYHPVSIYVIYSDNPELFFK